MTNQEKIQELQNQISEHEEAIENIEKEQDKTVEEIKQSADALQAIGPIVQDTRARKWLVQHLDQLDGELEDENSRIHRLMDSQKELKSELVDLIND